MNAIDVLKAPAPVIMAEQLQQVADAGAHFAISPGFSEAIAKAGKIINIPWSPGVVSASEIKEPKRSVDHSQIFIVHYN